MAGSTLGPLHNVQAQVTGRVYRVGYLGQGSKSSNLADGGRVSSAPAESAPARIHRGDEPDGRFALCRGAPRGSRGPGRTIGASLEPDVIVVSSAGLAMIVLGHTKTIPVVALTAGELQAEQGVRSLAKPGGNLTGMQLFSPETMGKRLQLLQEVVPGLRRVAVLRGVPWSRPGYELYRDATATAAARLGIRVRFLQFETIGDLEQAFRRRWSGSRIRRCLVWANPHLNRAIGQEIFDLTDPASAAGNSRRSESIYAG